MKLPNIGSPVLMDVLSSIDQNIKKSPNYLGIDTEMLLERDKTILWPHVLGLPQEREPRTEITGASNAFDWHGDGFGAELCVFPSACIDTLLGCSFGPAFHFLFTKLKATNIRTPAVYIVPEKIVEEAPAKAKRLGCMPSTNIYGDNGDPSKLGTFKRTTGCHLHISAEALKKEKIAKALVLWADVVVGSIWTYISPVRPILEVFRRKAYGRAGEFRLKSYPTYETDKTSTISSEYGKGVEYRVLPGSVMRHPVYITLMLNLYRSALRLAVEKDGNPLEETSIAAKEAINGADKIKAQEVIDSLPLSGESRKLLDILREKPLKAITIEQWITEASNYRGHLAFGYENGLVSKIKGPYTYHNPLSRLVVVSGGAIKPTY